MDNQPARGHLGTIPNSRGSVSAQFRIYERTTERRNKSVQPRRGHEVRERLKDEVELVKEGVGIRYPGRKPISPDCNFGEL
jgi:hypothetical protein